MSFFSDQTKIMPCGQKSLIANLRFFFTHRTSNLNYLKKFMDDMETRTLSDIICDNTIIEKVQERALEIPNPVTNPIRVCARSAGTREPAVSGSAATGTGDSGPGPLTTVPNIFLETTQSPVPIKQQLIQQQQQQRVPKALGPAKFSLNPNFNFESLRPRSASRFPGPVRPPHQSIFDAFRKLQTREFRRIQANSSNVKPVKFLERFDHSDAIILVHP